MFKRYLKKNKYKHFPNFFASSKLNYNKFPWDKKWV